MVTRSKPTAATLENFYKVVRKTMEDVYYSKEEIEELKRDKTFLRKGRV